MIFFIVPRFGNTVTFGFDAVRDKWFPGQLFGRTEDSPL